MHVRMLCAVHLCANSICVHCTVWDTYVCHIHETAPTLTWSNFAQKRIGPDAPLWVGGQQLPRPKWSTTRKVLFQESHTDTARVLCASPKVIRCGLVLEVQGLACKLLLFCWSSRPMPLIYSFDAWVVPEYCRSSIVLSEVGAPVPTPPCGCRLR